MKEDVWLINGDFGVSREHKVLVDDGFLMVKSLPSDARSESSKPRKMEWVVVCVLSSGSAICAINGEECTLHAYDMLLALPGTVLWDGERSADLLMDCLCISRKMLEEALPFSMYNWDVMAFLATHPVFNLSEAEYARFSLFYTLMSDKLKHQDEAFYKESMRCLLKAFLYDFSNVIARFMPSQGSVRYSQGANLFKRFLDMLASTHPKPRTVTFYAEKLNVTPKYLSAVCKNASGHTASDLIHKAVTKEIADLLSYSDKSIKEIMVEMDFPSLSFFGKYVKKHFGMGPKEFRAKRST